MMHLPYSILLTRNYTSCCFGHYFLSPSPNAIPPPNAITAASRNVSCQKRMGKRRMSVSEYRKSHESPSKNRLWNPAKKFQNTLGLRAIPTTTINPTVTASPTISHPPRINPRRYSGHHPPNQAQTPSKVSNISEIYQARNAPCVTCLTSSM